MTQNCLTSRLESSSSHVPSSEGLSKTDYFTVPVYSDHFCSLLQQFPKEHLGRLLRAMEAWEKEDRLLHLCLQEQHVQQGREPDQTLWVANWHCVHKNNPCEEYMCYQYWRKNSSTPGEFTSHQRGLRILRWQRNQRIWWSRGRKFLTCKKTKTTSTETMETGKNAEHWTYLFGLQPWQLKMLSCIENVCFLIFPELSIWHLKVHKKCTWKNIICNKNQASQVLNFCFMCVFPLKAVKYFFLLYKRDVGIHNFDFLPDDVPLRPRLRGKRRDRLQVAARARVLQDPQVLAGVQGRGPHHEAGRGQERVLREVDEGVLRHWYGQYCRLYGIFIRLSIWWPQVDIGTTQSCLTSRQGPSSRDVLSSETDSSNYIDFFVGIANTLMTVSAICPRTSSMAPATLGGWERIGPSSSSASASETIATGEIETQPPRVRKIFVEFSDLEFWKKISDVNAMHILRTYSSFESH